MLQKGSSLIEVLVGLAVILGTALATASAIGAVSRLSSQNLHAAQANYLLEGRAEEIRFLRDQSWADSIASFAPVTATDGIFTIASSATPVYRNSSDDIAASGSLDPNTKKFTVVVSWPEGGATASRSLSFYLTNIFEN